MEKEKLIELGKEKDKCSACGACYSICPKKAITFEENEFGYEYPVINEELCIKCGLCVSKCTYKLLSELNVPIETYAARAEKDKVLKNSASGGAYATIAYNFVRDGYVAGAIGGFDKGIYFVRHELGNEPSLIEKQQGSKYVQSRAYECYDDIKEALKSGKRVLFCGTPCQVDAVKRITGDPENLFTIDLICHGVPSLAMLNGFITELSKTLHGKVVGLKFRDKDSKKAYTSSIYLNRRGSEIRVVVSSELLSYYKYFLSGSICRDNCYNCRYACAKRVGDLTIGDYWGIEKHHPESAEKNHWSCIMVNTKKGQLLIKSYSTGLELIESEYEWVKESNKQLSEPNHQNLNRQEILSLYSAGGYRSVEKYFRKSRNGSLRYLRQLFMEIKKNKGNYEDK